MWLLLLCDSGLAKYYERDCRPTKPSICYLALYRKSWLTSGLKIQLSFVSQYADGREGNLLVAKLTLGRPMFESNFYLIWKESSSHPVDCLVTTYGYHSEE